MSLLFRAVLILSLSSCGSGSVADAARGREAPEDPAQADALYPDVLAAEASRNSDGSWRFDVTLSSPYDSPERYADAWRILSPDGQQLGLRILRHDHRTEQPFTRSLDQVQIPADVARVTIEGRDQLNGWGGAKIEVGLEP